MDFGRTVLRHAVNGLGRPYVQVNYADTATFRRWDSARNLERQKRRHAFQLRPACCKGFCWRI